MAYFIIITESYKYLFRCEGLYRQCILPLTGLPHIHIYTLTSLHYTSICIFFFSGNTGNILLLVTIAGMHVPVGHITGWYHTPSCLPFQLFLLLKQDSLYHLLLFRSHLLFLLHLPCLVSSQTHHLKACLQMLVLLHEETSQSILTGEGFSDHDYYTRLELKS